jgi:iron complex transport system ATP-binding protein
MDTVLLETQSLDIGYAISRQMWRVVVRDINLQLQRGELVCLVGPNGAGKSTLLRTLAGLQPSRHGKVILNGQDIHRLDPRELATQLSIVLTERVDIDNLTVQTLVSLGRHPYTDWTGKLTEQDEEIITQAMNTIGVSNLASRHVNELSDGERQKVMIARALAQDPYLMILDEPTAYLDLPFRVEIMHILRRLAREGERSIILSTHDLDLALRSADVMWLLPPGGPLEVGAPEDLVLNGSFEAAFHRETVDFDRQTGTFIFHPDKGPQIALVGDGLSAHWTGHALEREGYQINPNAAIIVTILGQNGSMRWSITTGGEVSLHHSIRDLIQHLRYTV